VLAANLTQENAHLDFHLLNLWIWGDSEWVICRHARGDFWLFGRFPSVQILNFAPVMLAALTHPSTKKQIRNPPKPAQKRHPKESLAERADSR
jgi:hypothetical protein